MPYTKELNALRESGRFRTREICDESLCDFATNDYLGLSQNKELHEKSANYISSLKLNSSKASMLVCGYHQAHKDFEKALCAANGFEDGIVLGSGFNANIALMDSLVRKGDALFMDELYHASGIYAARGLNVKFFAHNDMQVLEQLLKDSKAKRKIIAVEGIYSMDGDMVDRAVFELSKAYDAILVIDEAHSSGVVGEKLMGVFDHYGVKIEPNYIKMGTLGKAYGSFGAFILASSHIVEYLINRAKPVIYATSLSLYDTKLAHEALEHILQNSDELKAEITLRQRAVELELGMKIDGLIAPVLVGDNFKVMQIKELLRQKGYLVGAIREPTVKKAILRVIARVGESVDELVLLLKEIKKLIA